MVVTVVDVMSTNTAQIANALIPIEAGFETTCPQTKNGTTSQKTQD